MKAARYRLSEAVRVELRLSGRLIMRRFAAGIHTPTTTDDRLALEHLVATGHARPVRTRRPRPPKEDQ